MILVAVVLRTIGAFRVFDLIYVLTGNGARRQHQGDRVLCLRPGLSLSLFGYGAAISWLITACMLVLIVIYMHGLRTEGRGAVKLAPPPPSQTGERRPF